MIKDTEKMTEEELKEFTDFLDYFGVNYSNDVIYVNSGHYSIIMNPNTQWKSFLGYSICDVINVVAKKLNKRIIYDD